MYVKHVSLRNFGPFSKADFEFSGAAINIVVGANATGKTQLCGAIIAAIVGRPAVQIREGATGPSEVSVTLMESFFTEMATLYVTENSPGTVSVSQEPCPLAIQILATMSDPYGARLVLAEGGESHDLINDDLKVIESELPEGIKYHERWLQMRNNWSSNQYIGSRGEHDLALVVRELAIRKKTKSSLPLLIDGLGMHWDQPTRGFAVEVLNEIAKLSQVIIFTNREDFFVNGTTIEIFQPERRSDALAGYNNRLFAPQSTGRRRRQTPAWIKGAKFPDQESRICELKEIKGNNPIGSIKSLVDQYAVAFMNAGVSQNGSIYWGVRDEDLSIIGVSLSERECDELRRVVTEKLHKIAPAIAPTAYQIELHPVSDGMKIIDGLYLVEVRIPAVRRTLLFATGSQEVYVKTDAGKRRLSAVEIQCELLRRVGVEPYF